MAKKNDDAILELTKKIEDKKSALGKKKIFSPITNCSLEWNGKRVNISAMQKDTLVPLLVSLHSQMTSAEKLGVLNDYMISGFIVSDWIDDIQQRLTVLERESEHAHLVTMERRLKVLLSQDKQVELEIENMAKDI